MTTLQQITAGYGADTMVNENFSSVSAAALYSRDPVTSTGLTWGYKGGQYNGSTIADGTISLTASNTNYIVANRTTGVVSASTATTNWNDATNYLRLFSAVAGSATVTSWTDYRQIIGMSANSIATITDFAQNVGGTSGLVYAWQSGMVRQDNTVTSVAGGNVTLSDNTTNYLEVSASGNVSTNTSGFTSGRLPLATLVTLSGAITNVNDKRAPLSIPPANLAYTNTQNSFTKSQTVVPVANANVSGTYTPDATASNSFALTMTGNTTLANPTGLTNGQVLNFCVDQDGTGGRTLAFGTMYKWPGATAPTWTTSASAKNFFSAYYDGTILRCSGGAGFA